MMRVVRVITRLNLGGPAKHVGWVMTRLDKRKFEQVLLAGPTPPWEDDLGEWVRGLGVDWRELPLVREPAPLKDLRAVWGVLRVLWGLRPHILHTHTAKAGFVGRAAAMLFKPLALLTPGAVPKVVHTFHGHSLRGYFSPGWQWLFLWLERIVGWLGTDLVVVLSEGLRRELAEELRVAPRRRFVVVPLGIDLQGFAPGRNQQLRRQWGVGEEEILVGAVGRLAAVKNYPLMLHTMAALKAAAPDLYRRMRFVIIGGGPPGEFGRLRALASALGVDRRLILAGPRTDPKRFFPALDILLLTSKNEGTPVAILEAGACGLGVVATEVGGVVDLLGPEVMALGEGARVRLRGVGAARAHPGALARAVAWLAGDERRRRLLGGMLRRYVLANHSLEALTDRLESIYMRLAGR